MFRFWHKNNFKDAKISNVVPDKVRAEKYILENISGVPFCWMTTIQQEDFYFS